MDKKQLSERDICTKFITPAVKQAGWNEFTQIREEVYTKGRIILRAKLVTCPYPADEELNLGGRCPSWPASTESDPR